MCKMLSCNCLNVIIESEGNDFQQVTADSLDLTEDEKKDIFFSQEIKRVNKLNRISKEHSGLVVSRIIGNWILHQCLNCDVHTHAIHRNRGAGCVLVSAKLLEPPTIATLRSSELFSNVFHVVMPSEKEKSGETHQPENLSPDVQLALGGLKQRASEALKRETAATEERIRQFTEQQYTALDKFRERATKEHKVLERVILEKRHQTTSSTTNTSMEMQPNNRLFNDKVPVTTANTNLLSDKTKNKTVPKKVIKPDKASLKQMNTALTYNNSFTMDDEEMFRLDEQGDGRPMSSSEQEDSENEVTESGRNEHNHVGRSKSTPINMAKSLPVNIPAFMSPYRTREIEDDHDDILQGDEHPSDIAASIKALAKSVHGDTVFGDLPRPRFSTQI